MNALPLIEAKRDGKVLSLDQIQRLIAGYTHGEIPDYQMAALLMAIYFRGLDASETRSLTYSMRDSGDVLKFSEDARRPVVDKHSTGGIGDKVSLPLAPLLACLGFRVPMISGRALGITGGTLDKLESIPGFKTQLAAAEIVQQVEEVGCVICGQTAKMCPADRLMYALRDVTGTVPAISLIAASILSKKLAEGIQALVLDVKFGRAAFLATQGQAQALAALMSGIAEETGVRIRALLTTMDAALGRAAGNWLEVKEAVACLDGQGPADVRELVIECAAHLMVLVGKVSQLESARARALDVLTSGGPRRKWDEMLHAQGSDPATFTSSLDHDHLAAVVLELKSHRSGFVTQADARTIGEVVRDLGGGRMKKDLPIDPAVGIDQIASLGTAVSNGGTLCRVHAQTQAQAEDARRRLEEAFHIDDSPVNVPARLAEIL